MDKSVYQGEFRKDYEWGHGKKILFKHPSIISIQGVWKKGRYPQKSKILLKNGSIYIGETAKGSISGKGKIFYKENESEKRVFYSGMIVKGKFNGNGMLKMYLNFS